MKNLRHASLVMYGIYAVYKFHFFSSKIKEDVLAQRTHVQNWNFVFPNFSYDKHFMYPFKTYMAGKLW